MLKRLFESYLMFTRWLIAPFLVMLTIGLVALMVHAGEKTWDMVKQLLGAHDKHITLEVLNLIDITLSGALVLIVTISVYENFVSAVTPEDHKGWPDWMGNIDFAQLKLKLLTTLVAISAIKLLEALMDVPEIPDRVLYFYIGIHLTFVLSTVAFALAEKLSGHGGGSHADHRRQNLAARIGAFRGGAPDGNGHH